MRLIHIHLPVGQRCLVQIFCLSFYWIFFGCVSARTQLVLEPREPSVRSRSGLDPSRALSRAQLPDEAAPALIRSRGTGVSGKANSNSGRKILDCDGLNISSLNLNSLAHRGNSAHQRQESSEPPYSFFGSLYKCITCSVFSVSCKQEYNE